MTRASGTSEYAEEVEFGGTLFMSKRKLMLASSYAAFFQQPREDNPC
jgi:hypothetical protein